MLLYIFKNLKNRFWHNFFLIIILSIGVISFTTVMNVIQAAQSDVEKQLQDFGANIAIYPQSEQFTLNYGGLNLGGVDVQSRDFLENDKNKILEIPNREEIKYISSKLIGLVKIHKKSRIIVGTDIQTELNMKKWWHINGNIPKNNEILIGSEIAQELDLNIKDSIKIYDPNTNNQKIFSVSGIINKTETQDDRVFFLNLINAQELLNKQGKVSFFEVTALCQSCPIEEITEQLYSKFPEAKIITMKQLIEQQTASVNRLSKLGLAVSLVIIFIALITFSLSMVSYIKERTKEIAVMKTVGFTNKNIASIIIGQSIIIALIVAILASIVTPFSSYYLINNTLSLSSSINFSFSPSILLSTIVLSILSSYLAIRRAISISVTEAFREV